MNYHVVCKKSNTTGSTGGAETAYPSGESEFTPVLVGFVLVIIVHVLTFFLASCCVINYVRVQLVRDSSAVRRLCVRLAGAVGK